MDTATPMKIATCRGASRVAMNVITSTTASSVVESRQIRMWRRLMRVKESPMTRAAKPAFGT